MGQHAPTLLNLAFSCHSFMSLQGRKPGLLAAGYNVRLQMPTEWVARSPLRFPRMLGRLAPGVLLLPLCGADNLAAPKSWCRALHACVTWLHCFLLP